MPNSSTWQEIAKSGNVNQCQCGGHLVVDWFAPRFTDTGIIVAWTCVKCDTGGQFALDLAAVYELHDGEYAEVASVRRVKPKRPTGWTRATFTWRSQKWNADTKQTDLVDSPIEGVVKGPLGVAKNQGWRITHIPTGLRLGDGAGTQARAREAADRILALPGLVDLFNRWTLDAAPPEWLTYEHRDLVSKILWSMSNGGAWPTMPEGVTV